MQQSNNKQRFNPQRMKQSLIGLTPKLLLVAVLLLLVGTIYFGWQWKHAAQMQQAIKTQNFPKKLNEHDYLMAAHQAYWLGQQDMSKSTITKQLHALNIAEAAPDPTFRAYANFIRANLYYDLSKLEQNIAAGGAHQQAVAQIELAREAYKKTIRQLPQLHDAKFNLELLDRLAPPKRTQGWQGGVDGVTLQPFKRNGTAMMRDNQRRGLP